MKHDEILQAAKDVGLLHPDAKAASRIVFDFAAIIEKRTIERCAAICDSVNNYDNPMTATDCAAAIRKLGEQIE